MSPRRQICRLRKEFLAAKTGTILDPKVWDKVQIFLLFIGYERSGHSLVSALLDAHPNMVIADEFQVFGAWQRFHPNNRTRNNLFQALYSNTVQVAKSGERSLEDCKSILGGYKYHVPNQWQGRFHGIIQVAVSSSFITLYFLLENLKVSINGIFLLQA